MVRAVKYDKRLGAEAPASGTIVLGTDIAAVVLGLHNWVYMVTSGGKTASWAGTDILRRIMGHHARGQQLRKETRTQAACYRGRGRWRRRKKLLELSDAWARYTDTRSKQIASDIVRTAIRKGCNVIVLRDMSGIRDEADVKVVREQMSEEVNRLIHKWPYYKLQQAIMACAERNGLQVVIIEAETLIANVCPACMQVQADADPHTKPSFKCVNPDCAFTRGRDAVRAMRLLLAAGEEGAVEVARIEERKFHGARARASLVGSVVGEYAARVEELRKQIKAERKERKKAAEKAQKNADKSVLHRERETVLTDEMESLKRGETPRRRKAS
jgi:IS605 OrfB family transposase